MKKESDPCPAAGGRDAAGSPDRLRRKDRARADQNPRRPRPLRPKNLRPPKKRNPPKPAEEPSTAVTLTDMTGREITLDEPATRIVALTPSDCEILYAIGAGDLLVGRGKYCDYPAEVTEIPAVESGCDTNIEQIVELAAGPAHGNHVPDRRAGPAAGGCGRASS